MPPEQKTDDGWIELSKRMPTELDANKTGGILFHTRDGTDCVWHWTMVDDSITHWKPLLPPPRIKTQAEIDAEEDEKAWDIEKPWLVSTSAACLIGDFKRGWIAGRASMRGKVGK